MKSKASKSQRGQNFFSMLMTEEKPLATIPPPDNKMYCVAKSIKEGCLGRPYIYCMQDGNFYCYDKGYWQKVFPEDFLGIIEENIKGILRFSISMRKQILENFKTVGRISLDKFNQMPLLNLENYMIDIEGGNILSHKPEYYSTIRIPYKYDDSAKCELWIKTLGEIFEGDQNKVIILQEFLGYCLSSDNEQKKGLLLLGDTDTGKSTIIDIIRELLGDENVSNVPLDKLCDQQHIPQLINKKLNVDPDVNKNSVNYEREFKIITGGKNEKISCNQKYIPAFEFTPKCKIILAANEFPKITDHSSAFYQRLLVIPCERRFREHEKNRLLHDQLKKELPGILNWAIEGFKNLKRRGRFEKYDFMANAVQELEDENNPVNDFFKEYIVVDQTDNIFIEKGELYEKYKEWMKRNNEYPLSKSRFSMCVYKKYHAYTPKDTHHTVTLKRIWKNIKFKSESIANPVWNE